MPPARASVFNCLLSVLRRSLYGITRSELYPGCTAFADGPIEIISNDVGEAAGTKGGRSNAHASLPDK